MSNGMARTISPRLIIFFVLLVVFALASAPAVWAGPQAPAGDGDSGSSADHIGVGGVGSAGGGTRAAADSVSAAGNATPLVGTGSGAGDATGGASGKDANAAGDSTNTGSTAAIYVQAQKPGAPNVLKPEQIALAAQKAGFAGETLVTAVAVAMAESSGDANVVNSIHAYGLWQILASAHPDLIRSSDPDASRWFDPYTNASFAWQISSKGKDWTPWEAYTTGAHKKYLGDARAAVDLLAGSLQSVVAPAAK